MTDNLLGSGTDDTPQLDPNKDYLQELIGPGGKFHDPDEKVALQKLARGKVESDSYVPILTSRLDALRDDYLKLKNEAATGQTLKEMLDQYSEKVKFTSSEQPKANEMQMTPSYDPKEVESLVSNKILQHEQKVKEDANFNLVKAKLTEAYGDNYKNIVSKQSQELGLTDEEVNSLARKNPKLFIKTFDLDAPKNSETFQSPIASQRRNDNFAPRTEKRNWAYYEEMRVKDPTKYHSPKIAIQMQDDAIALREDFYK